MSLTFYLLSLFPSWCIPLKYDTSGHLNIQVLGITNTMHLFWIFQTFVEMCNSCKKYRAPKRSMSVCRFKKQFFFLEFLPVPWIFHNCSAAWFQDNFRGSFYFSFFSNRGILFASLFLHFLLFSCPCEFYYYYYFLNSTRLTVAHSLIGGFWKYSHSTEPKTWSQFGTCSLVFSTLVPSGGILFICWLHVALFICK